MRRRAGRDGAASPTASWRSPRRHRRGRGRDRARATATREPAPRASGGIPRTDFDATLEALAGSNEPRSSAQRLRPPRPRAAAASRHAAACPSAVGAHAPRSRGARHLDPPDLDRRALHALRRRAQLALAPSPPARCRARLREQVRRTPPSKSSLARSRARGRSTVAATSRGGSGGGLGLVVAAQEQPEGASTDDGAIMEAWRDPRRSPWARSRAGCGATAAGRRTSRFSFTTRAS